MKSVVKILNWTKLFNCHISYKLKLYPFFVEFIWATKLVNYLSKFVRNFCMKNIDCSFLNCLESKNRSFESFVQLVTIKTSVSFPITFLNFLSHCQNYISSFLQTFFCFWIPILIMYWVKSFSYLHLGRNFISIYSVLFYWIGKPKS